MAGHGEKLSRKQELALANLLTCPSIADAAKQTGIGEHTLFRWLKDDAFAEAYMEARRQVVRHAIARVQQACTQAVETLQAIMGNPEAPASARVSAARTVLETAIKAVELEDLEQRLSVLEAQMQEGRANERR